MTLNKNQRKATYVALGVFAVSILFAPWELSFKREHLGTRHAPAWSAPAFEDRGEVTLMVGSLMIEWVGIGVFYAAALKLLQSPTKDSRSKG
jgi:hypothetical protein